MKRILALMTVALLGACGTLPIEEEIEATRDFIVANELKEIDSFRMFEQLHYRAVNDYFVTVETRRGDYLIEFNTRCRALTQRDFKPHMVDIRRDPSRLRARFDTIRGCMIGKIYDLTEQQREELHQLGDAPGEEVFMPEEEPEAAEEPDETDL